jgi:thiamine-phosphate pyrophosphorylase
MSRLRPPANRLYAIVDTGFFGPEPAAAAEAVRTLLESGVRWIQLRAKDLPDLQVWRLAEAMAGIVEAATSGGGSTPDPPLFWINDRTGIAAALPAAGGLSVGLHLGQDDLPPAMARASLPEDRTIGRSTHSREQAIEADRDPAVDAVAIGPAFGTSTKDRPDPVVGLAGVAAARAVTAKPLIAIGGIDADRAPRVIEAGADVVAVISALDPHHLAASCHDLLRALR